MAKAEIDYKKHYQGVFRSKVMPAIKSEIAEVASAQNKLDSLTQRFQQNQEELTALANELVSIRSESVEHVMSQEKSDEYIQKISGIKGRISLLTDAQEEIKVHLLPELEKQLDTAYASLVMAADKMCLDISNQVKEETFETVVSEYNKSEGFRLALSSLNEKLKLRHPHRLDFENVPYFPDLEGVINKKKWWKRDC